VDGHNIAGVGHAAAAVPPLVGQTKVEHAGQAVMAVVLKQFIGAIGAFVHIIVAATQAPWAALQKVLQHVAAFAVHAVVVGLTNPGIGMNKP